MSIYEITAEQIKQLDVTTFGKQGIKEREDLQRFLLKDINVISPETYVLDEEFRDWQDSKRRIDILALDKEANLVVIELKRTEDGGHMELQAIRYAAMVSTLTFERAVEIHGRYLQNHSLDGDAETKILEFLGWEEPDDERFAQDVRIILASADFSKELTTSVMWLNNRDINIKCVRLKPYSDGSRTLIEVQQVIPLPEAEDYQIKLREKEQQVRSPIVKEKYILRKKFWGGLLNHAKDKTKLHENLSPSRRSNIGTSAGFRGISYKYLLRKNEVKIQLYIDTKDAEKNRKLFNQLKEHEDEIEKNFGKPLNWKEVEENRSCSISYTVLNIGYSSDDSKWPETYSDMVDAMITFEQILRAYIDKLED